MCCNYKKQQQYDKHEMMSIFKTLGLALLNQHISLYTHSVNLPREIRKRMEEFIEETSGEPLAKKVRKRKNTSQVFEKDVKVLGTVHKNKHK